jgi:hypothetical protein
MTTKVCTSCESTKSLNEFYYRKDRNVYESRCKECCKTKSKNYFKNNKVQIAISTKKYRELNHDDILKKKEEYRQNNRELLSKKQSEYTKNRLKTDVYFRLKMNLRSRIKEAIKNAAVVKSGPTFELLGCTPDDVRVFLEAEFSQGMTWDNYGKEWHVDHIKPCARFNLEDPEEQKKCFHWTNLQPLWAIDNLKKGSR